MKLAWNHVTTIVILALKITEIWAGCYWNVGNPGTECLMYCIASDTTAVISEIEERFNETGKEDCRNNGIWLRLRTLVYPNDTIEPHWFTGFNVNLTVFNLEVYLNDVTSVSNNAFDSIHFRTVKQFLFENCAIGTIRNGTFNGLNELEIINIRGAGKVNRIESGILDNLTELKEFTFEQSLKGNPEININGITGSSHLSKLEYVKIKYNLGDGVKRTTFTGLTNVKILDLSSCQIKSIEENSFDPISATIEELNLSSNLLTTVTSLFSQALPSIKMIYINGNSWNCICELLPFRLFIEQYQEHFNSYVCSSPTHCNSKSMLETDCFDECDTPTTTTTAPTTAPITTPPTTPTTANPDVSLQCHPPNEFQVPDTVSMKRPIGYMTIKETEHGEINLLIEKERSSSSLVVIWFSENQSSGKELYSDDINCISSATSIPITNWEANVVYSICLMEKESTTVSPLDCISYTKRQGRMEAVWLFESSKTLIIILVVVGALLNVAIGIAIGFRIFNCNTLPKQNNQMTKFPIETASYQDNMKNRISNMTSYTNNTMLTTRTSVPFDAYSYNCPPLPERPAKLFEEPVYSSVEER